MSADQQGHEMGEVVGLLPLTPLFPARPGSQWENWASLRSFSPDFHETAPTLDIYETVFEEAKGEGEEGECASRAWNADT